MSSPLQTLKGLFVLYRLLCPFNAFNSSALMKLPAIEPLSNRAEHLIAGVRAAFVVVVVVVWFWFVVSDDVSSLLRAVSVC